jgi:hypothetical protein
MSPAPVHRQIKAADDGSLEFWPLKKPHREMLDVNQGVSDEHDKEQVPVDHGGAAGQRQPGVGAKHA